MKLVKFSVDVRVIYCSPMDEPSAIFCVVPRCRCHVEYVRLDTLGFGTSLADLLQPLHANISHGQREAASPARHEHGWLDVGNAVAGRLTIGAVVRLVPAFIAALVGWRLVAVLERELAPLSRDTETVLVSSRGGSYTDGSLSVRMADWCHKAGIEAGYTMHGLRKALGVKMAEADASTRQLMETLGHNNIAYAELYSREASQMRLAVQAMDKVAKVEEARRKPKISAVK